MESSDKKKIDEINSAVNSILNGSVPEKIDIENINDDSLKELAANVNKLIINKSTLLDKEEIFRAFAKSSLDGILLLSSKGNIRYWNQGAFDIFGYSREEAEQKYFHELFAAHERNTLFDNRFPQFLISGKGNAVRKKHELVGLKKNGTEVPVELTLSSVKIAEEWISVAFIHDITERKEKDHLEKKLFESHRMESIGTLASGIAHDFNNILALVMGYTELAIVDVDDNSILETELKEVYKACLRAKLLVKQIMTYAMHSEEEFIPVQVSSVAKEALALLRTTIPKSIEFKEDLSDNSIVMADPTKIHQIFMNICTNAYQSMEDGGELSVTLSAETIGGDDFDELTEGKYLKIEISDTGKGISDENLKKVFDPYYTTKPFGKGTGLGLAVVQGVVKSCEGHIYAESTVGKGSSFYIFLPVTENEARDEKHR